MKKVAILLSSFLALLQAILAESTNENVIRPDVVVVIMNDGIEYAKSVGLPWARQMLLHDPAWRRVIFEFQVETGWPANAWFRWAEVFEVGFDGDTAKLGLREDFAFFDFDISQMRLRLSYRVGDPAGIVKFEQLNVKVLTTRLQCNVTLNYRDQLLPTNVIASCQAGVGRVDIAGGGLAPLLPFSLQDVIRQKFLQEGLTTKLTEDVSQKLNKFLPVLREKLAQITFSNSSFENITIGLSQAGPKRYFNESGLLVPVALSFKNTAAPSELKPSFDPRSLCAPHVRYSEPTAFPKAGHITISIQRQMLHTVLGFLLQEGISSSDLGIFNSDGEGMLAEALNKNCKADACMMAILGIKTKWDPNVAYAKDLELKIEGDVANAKALCESTFNASERSVHVTVPLRISCTMRYLNSSIAPTSIFQVQVEVSVDLRGITNNATHLFVKQGEKAVEVSLKFVNGSRLYHLTKYNYTIEERMAELFKMVRRDIPHALWRIIGAGLAVPETGIPGLSITPEVLAPGPSTNGSQDESLAIALHLELDIDVLSNITRKQIKCKKYSYASCSEKKCDDEVTCDGQVCFMRGDFELSDLGSIVFRELEYGCLSSSPPIMNVGCSDVNRTTNASGNEQWKRWCVCDGSDKCNADFNGSS